MDCGRCEYTALPRYPAVERDFSFVFGDSVEFEKLEKAVAGLGLAELTTFVPVEIFRGGTIPAGECSLLLRATFQSGERTLREDEVAQWSGADCSEHSKDRGREVAAVEIAIWRPGPGEFCQIPRETAKLVTVSFGRHKVVVLLTLLAGAANWIAGGARSNQRSHFLPSLLLSRRSAHPAGALPAVSSAGRSGADATGDL